MYIVDRFRFWVFMVFNLLVFYSFNDYGVVVRCVCYLGRVICYLYFWVGYGYCSRGSVVYVVEVSIWVFGMDSCIGWSFDDVVEYFMCINWSCFFGVDVIIDVGYDGLKYCWCVFRIWFSIEFCDLCGFCILEYGVCCV